MKENERNKVEYEGEEQMNGLQQGNCIINLPHLRHLPPALCAGSYRESHYEKINCSREPAECPSVTSLMFQHKSNHLRVCNVNSGTHSLCCFTQSFRFAVFRQMLLTVWFLFFSSILVDLCGPCCHIFMPFIMNKVDDLAHSVFWFSIKTKFNFEICILVAARWHSGKLCCVSASASGFCLCGSFSCPPLKLVSFLWVLWFPPAPKL